MTIQELIDILYPPSTLPQLTPAQLQIVWHPSGPGWVLAGPGSGKTETLTVLVMRLLYVSGDSIQPQRILPDSILITTFTEKAARNLEDRIAGQRARLIAADPALAAIDVSKLRIGTLHSLCNDILQESRAPNYQNVRLMDGFEQALFVREHMSLIRTANPATDIPFWQAFSWFFAPNQFNPAMGRLPNRWNATKALVSLLNRIVEDRVSVPALRAAGGQLGRAADLFDEYVQRLQNTYRCDFAQLQARFLDFLATPVGTTFRDGDGTPANPGIQWVLVDEYQDTNPMQEAVYFELARSAPHNLVVVGDDDQAMYRFRGGSVECMVSFDQACQAFLGLPAAGVSRYPLVDNFRSHPDIITFYNQYLSGFPTMRLPGARAPKPAVVSRKVIPQVYPAVGTIEGRTLDNLATLFAQAVRGMVDNERVNDPNECCLLLKSTRESPRNAGPYVAALQAVGLPAYNPRNKAFADQEEVQGLLGAILAILDPQRRYATDPANRGIPSAEADIRATYDRLAAASPPLANYVAQSSAAIRAKPGQFFDAQLQELSYYILSLDPFSAWQNDPVRRVRLARLTALLEAFASMPILDSAGVIRPNLTRGLLRASTPNPGEVYGAWLGSFYNLFIGYVSESGFDDEEDEDAICPPGMVPVMTMHQCKGLQFPYVFVGHMGENPEVNASHQLETLLAPYPINSARTFARPSEAQRAEMDMIRQYYVAYSRAKYALILLGTKAQFARISVPLGPTRNWMRRVSRPL